MNVHGYVRPIISFICFNFAQFEKTINQKMLSMCLTINPIVYFSANITLLVNVLPEYSIYAKFEGNKNTYSVYTYTQFLLEFIFILIFSLIFFLLQSLI